MKQKNRAPVNWMLRAASILLCLVLVSSYLVCGMFARYTTSASGSDSARVAKFEIKGGEISSSMITADLVPGEIKACEIKIENKSEVAVDYEVIIKKMESNLPLTFKVYDTSYTGDEGYLTGVTDATGETTFSAHLVPNSEQKTYKLFIEWPKEKNSSKYAGYVDTIQVTVSATQID